LGLLSITACNITKVVPEGQQLLVKNKIIRTDDTRVNLPDEYASLRQKPNRKLIGFIKFHLWAYQYGNKGLGITKKKHRLRKLAEKVGEAPVLIDSAKMRLSASKLSDYYFSKGFLENSVSYTVTPRKIFKKRAYVTYYVKLHDFTQIRSLVYNVSSKEIETLLNNTTNNQKIKVGQRVDFDKIEAERNRITEMLRDNGYFYFNNSFIDFQIDTNQAAQSADMGVNIRGRKNGEPHYQQTVSRVTVIIGDSITSDTLIYDNLQFLQSDYRIKPSVLSKNVIFRPYDLYNASLVQKTYSNLLGMGIFNFVTIRFNPSAEDSLNHLDAEIILKTSKKHDFIWEPQTIYTQQSLGLEANIESFGVANNFSLLNRNVFGGAESFNISSYTSLETQIKRDNQSAFNSFRQTVNAEFAIPSLVYFERKDFSQIFIKKSTKITAIYLRDQNKNFTRNVLPISLVYAFTKGRTSYGITPLRVSVNQAKIDPVFLQSLDANSQYYTTQLLTDNIVMGPTTSLYWSNKDKNPNYFTQIRSNPIELSGNLASLYYNVIKGDASLDKEIFNVKYSQYARSDFNIILTNVVDENNSLAYRGYIGAGLPYGNTRFLPFERRFFVGGGNSLRAWRPRTIGPGSYSDSSSLITIEKTGEFALQGSAEYRFDIIDKVLDGAVFVDAGNIWNFREDPSFENGNFKLDRFYKEIAINSGVGLRFDLSYVVFRTDWGIALHDPSVPAGSRWIIQDFFNSRWVFDHTAINFAIGYPF
jgi:outer membrane protein assembly factor BamA